VYVEWRGISTKQQGNPLLTDIGQTIEHLLAHLGLPSRPDAVAALSAYAEAVCDWNRRVNLTDAKDIRAFVDGPLFDALTVAPVVHPRGTLVDVGSGGGLPGVPLAILYPSLEVTLSEPRGKRADFLTFVTSLLHLSAAVVRTQDRELPPGAFDGAVAQAVFPPEQWIPRGRRLLRSGGYLYVLSSAPLAPGMLPASVSADASTHWRRPLDDARRFAFRLVCR